MAPRSLWTVLAFMLPAAVAGVLREMDQHRDDHPMMTLHRWIEGLAWATGAGIAALFL